MTDDWEMLEFNRFEVDGEKVVSLDFETPLPVTGSRPVVVALISDSVDELLSKAAWADAYRMLHASVRRRNITPSGVWAVAATPVDFPGWQSYLKKEIADEVEAKRVEINGHVRVYALFDSATMRYVN